MIPARILGTSSVLPGRAVSTEEIARAIPGRSAAELEAKTGIRTRYWAPPGTCSAALGAEALRLALDNAGLKPEELRRIIFVNASGGDHLIPATANAVAHALGLKDTCDAFDINNACTGFITAFDLAARSAATGLAPVGVVVAEIYSDIIVPEDPRPYVIFGDAAAAVVIGRGRTGEGVTGMSLGNNGAIGNTVSLDHPRFTKRMSTIAFTVSNRQMVDVALDLFRRSAAGTLAQSGDRIQDIEWVLPHQPNGAMLKEIITALGVPPDRIVPVVQEIGSTGAATIPVSLDRLLRTRPVRPGDRILMVSVGSGVSYGAMMYRVAPG